MSDINTYIYIYTNVLGKPSHTFLSLSLIYICVGYILFSGPNKNSHYCSRVYFLAYIFSYFYGRFSNGDFFFFLYNYKNKRSLCKYLLRFFTLLLYRILSIADNDKIVFFILKTTFRLFFF